MNQKVHKLSMLLLVIFSLTWSSLVQAFFCLSIGAGADSKHRDRHYSQPFPSANFGAVAYPPLYYSPVLQNPVARRDLQPALMQPQTGGSTLRQQIFE